MKITIKNDFHRTEAVVRLHDGNIDKNQAVLSPTQTDRAINKLCGISGCRCGTAHSVEIKGEDRSDVEISNAPGSLFGYSTPCGCGEKIVWLLESERAIR